MSDQNIDYTVSLANGSQVLIETEQTVDKKALTERMEAHAKEAQKLRKED